MCRVEHRIDVIEQRDGPSILLILQDRRTVIVSYMVTQSQEKYTSMDNSQR